MTKARHRIFQLFLLTTVILVVGCSRQSSPTIDTTARVDDPRWTEAQPGLRCRLMLPKTSFSLGESISFTLEIQNVSDASQFQFTLHPENLRILTLDGKNMPYRGPQISQPALPIALSPTETYRFVRNVSPKDYHLSEGSYTAHCEDMGAADFTGGTLRTSPVQFAINTGEATP